MESEFVTVSKKELKRLLEEHKVLMDAAMRCDSIRCENAYDACFHYFAGIEKAVSE